VSQNSIDYVTLEISQSLLGHFELVFRRFVIATLLKPSLFWFKYKTLYVTMEIYYVLRSPSMIMNSWIYMST